MNMEMPAEIIAAGIVAMQGWTLRELVNLKTAVAEIRATCRLKNCDARESLPGGDDNEPQQTAREERLRVLLMKEKRKRRVRLFGGFMFVVATMLAAWLLTGCGTFSRGEVAAKVTNTVPVQTVTSAQPPPTLENPNPPPVVVTNTVLREVVTVVTNSVYSPAPNVIAAIETARAVNSVVPSPVSPLIDNALVLVASLLGAAAAWKTRVARNEGDKRALADAMLKAAIAGVESVGHEATKGAIANAAAGAGVSAQLDAKVQSVAAYVSAAPGAQPPKPAP